MNSIKNNTEMLFGKTHTNNTNSTSITIPREFSKKLGLQNSKVIMYLINSNGMDHLVLSKFDNKELI